MLISDLCFTNRYLFHGLEVEVASDHPAVLAALEARLRWFPAGSGGRSDLTFEFRCLPQGIGHREVAPPERMRPVYEPPGGAVLYSDTADQVSIADASGVHVWCDPVSGQVQVFLGSLDSRSIWTASHPLFTLALIELCKRRCRYSLHAAGLCVNGKGMLFAGSSGAGKSTLALTLLRAGFGFLSDDMLFLAPGQKGLRVLAFPDELDLTEDSTGFFPELHQLWARPKPAGFPKRPVRVEEIQETVVAGECRPEAVFFPRIAHTETSRVEPMTAEEAFLELVPNVLLTEARSTQAHLDVLAGLVRDTRCYRLNTGRDLEALPGLIRDLMGSPETLSQHCWEVPSR